MKKLEAPRHLYLVGGRDTIHEGPITRLGFWYRFPPVSRRNLYLYALTKILLVAALFYIAYGSSILK